jgi:ankyrin repeat protein
MKRTNIILIFAFPILLIAGMVWLVWKTTPQRTINDDLFDAVRKRNAPLVKQLIAQGANPNARLKERKEWLYVPSDEEAAEEPWREPTVLMIAAMHNDVSVVRVLLENGAKTDAKDNRGSSVADWASSSPQVAALIQKYPK